MRLGKSLLSVPKIMLMDAAFARIGSSKGWWTRTHYEGRWQNWRGRNPVTRWARCTVNDKQVRIAITAGHLGSLYGVFVDGEYDLTRCGIDCHATLRILDLGANVGMAAAYLQVLCPNAEFVCVEPDPRNIPLLRQTIQANGIRAQVVEAAVGATAREANLRVGNVWTCSALDSSPMHSLPDTIHVSVQTVPDILRSAGWDAVDILKMDIEGTEEEILSKSPEFLNSVGSIVMEIHPCTTPERVQGYIRHYGFRLSRLSFGSEPVYVALKEDFHLELGAV